MRDLTIYPCDDDATRTAKTRAAIAPPPLTPVQLMGIVALALILGAVCSFVMNEIYNHMVNPLLDRLGITL